MKAVQQRAAAGLASSTGGWVMKLRSAALSGLVGLVAGSLGAVAAPAQAATIVNPVFASSFTCPATVCGLDPSTVISLSGNADAMGAATRAANQLSSLFSNNVTANILVYGIHDGTNGFLAASLSSQTVYSYNQYTAALTADAAANPHNTVLNTAVANLPLGNGGADPNGTLMAVNTTDARALGLTNGVNTAFGVGNATPQFNATGNFVGGGGFADGVIVLNLDQPLLYNRPMPAFDSSVGPLYDAQTSLEHEMDEIMGIGGAGSQLNNANFDPNYAQDFYGVNGPLIGPMDLYRYQAPGLPSFDPFVPSITGCNNPAFCSGLPSPYFSVDGGLTFIDSFNQAFPVFGGDAADWGLNLFKLCPGGLGIGGTGDVQDAFSCNNHSADVHFGTPSYLAYEAIGYNSANAPEPAVWGLMITGFGLAGFALRRRRLAYAIA